MIFSWFFTLATEKIMKKSWFFMIFHLGHQKNHEKIMIFQSWFFMIFHLGHQKIMIFHDFFMIFLGCAWSTRNLLIWQWGLLIWQSDLSSNRSYCQKNRSYCQSNRPHCQTSRSLVNQAQPRKIGKNLAFLWFFVLFHLDHPRNHETSWKIRIFRDLGVLFWKFSEILRHIEGQKKIMKKSWFFSSEHDFSICSEQVLFLQKNPLYIAFCFVPFLRPEQKIMKKSCSVLIFHDFCFSSFSGPKKKILIGKWKFHENSWVLHDFSRGHPPNHDF